ncbi:hypothetical protein N7508_009615 [Penicillium antarcticum]|uniref:uncharacterized protein n=1 Tax=Penicillium antarcticum TaxID=416450 RepID=UPI002395FEF5|nr:uncharacterized protein N7508_009615 [Penicillium antarcticum]KAJ5294794.1 hypothetical protein N7508_009615 [Penicillium antarcticum]
MTAGGTEVVVGGMAGGIDVVVGLIEVAMGLVGVVVVCEDVVVCLKDVVFEPTGAIVTVEEGPKPVPLSQTITWPVCVTIGTFEVEDFDVDKLVVVEDLGVEVLGGAEVVVVEGDVVICTYVITSTPSGSTLLMLVLAKDEVDGVEG